ncbi:hypothetical protein MKW94_021674 [Papaver nudicaule]|uniref:Cathepsin propeptide inhibitor domain-containing protein n=1 Tax=Papaver nudicaule TaxID=74823 RepID=A0AA41S471_PAPNU|nr:hypothetical protein [Papaver nudicaule]
MGRDLSYSVGIVFLTCILTIAAIDSVEDSNIYQVTEKQSLNRKFIEDNRIHLDYGKEYSTREEYIHRLGVFAKNMIRAAKHQALDPTAIHGVTPFSDLSEDEFERLFTGLKSGSQPDFNEISTMKSLLFTGIICTAEIRRDVCPHVRRSSNQNLNEGGVKFISPIGGITKTVKKDFRLLKQEKKIQTIIMNLVLYFAYHLAFVLEVMKRKSFGYNENRSDIILRGYENRSDIILRGYRYNT